MAQTQKRAPVFLALIEEAIRSPGAWTRPAQPAPAAPLDDVVGRPGLSAVGAPHPRPRDCLVAKPPQYPLYENPFRPSRVISGEGPIAAAHPKSEARPSGLTPELARETAREVARELEAERHYKVARVEALEARRALEAERRSRVAPPVEKASPSLPEAPQTTPRVG